jgi:hypothetical protein
MKSLHLKNMRWPILLATIVTLISYAAAFPQSKKATVRLVSTDSLKMPEGAMRRILIQSEGKILPAYLFWQKGKPILSVAGKPQVELPYRLDLLVSRDAKTILQYGDEMKLDRPLRKDLFWISQEGQVVAELVDYFAGDARLTMSSDGFTAVSGSLITDPKNMKLALFSQSGTKLWERSLDSDARIEQMLVFPEGEYTAAIVTDRDKYLTNHRIEIWNSTGERQSSINAMGIVQTLVFLDGSDKAFVQGYSNYGLLEIPSGRLLWKIPGKIRMVSPYGAVLSPDGTVLFLLQAEIEGRRKGVYSWRLLILDSLSGEQLAADLLPDKYPSTWDRVFEKVTDSDVVILAGEQRIVYSWSK